MAAALRARRKGYAVTLIDRGHQLGFMNNSTAMIDSMLKTCVYDPVKAYVLLSLLHAITVDDSHGKYNPAQS